MSGELRLPTETPKTPRDRDLDVIITDEFLRHIRRQPVMPVNEEPIRTNGRNYEKELYNSDKHLPADMSPPSNYCPRPSYSLAR